MKPLLIGLFILLGLPCFSQQSMSTLNEAITLKTPPQIIAYFSGKGFKKSSENKQQIVLVKNKEKITLVKKEGAIKAIDYDTPDISQFNEWKKVLTKAEGGADFYVGWDFDTDCYYFASLKKGIATLSISPRL